MFKQIGKLYLSLSLLYIVLGVFILVAPKQFLDVAFYFIGGVLLLFGLIEITSFFAKSDSIVSLTGGIVATVLGIYLLFIQPERILNMVAFIAGLVLLAGNAANLKTTFEFKKEGVSSWWIALLFNLILMGLGILILFNPAWLQSAVLIIIGIVLIVNGGSNVWSFFIVKRSIKEMKKAMDAPPVVTVDGNAKAGDPAQSGYQPGESSYNPKA